MKFRQLLFPVLLLISSGSYGQVHIEGNFAIDSGVVWATPADVLSAANVGGKGTMLLNGTATQHLDFNNYSIPNLEVNNNANVLLSSGVTIGSSLVFTNGKVKIGNSNISFSPDANSTGAGMANYIITDGTGIVSHSLQANDTFLYPIGKSDAANDYTPAVIVNKIGSRTISVQVKDYASSASIEQNATSGVDRTWQISADIAGDAVIALTHNAAAAGSAFNNSAAFVTEQLSATGTHWSLGTPAAGVNNMHSGTFTIPENVDSTAYFSKSSNADYSLGEVPIRVYGVAQTMFDVKVAPNPFTDEVWLNISAKAQQDLTLTISDVQGRIIMKQALNIAAGNQQQLLEVGDLLPGMYHLQLTGATVNASYKIVKQ